MEQYTDLLPYSRPASHHIPMPVSHRAKQFAPFAALKGYEESIQETQERHLFSTIVPSKIKSRT